jgi:hypothetical protein
MTNIGIRYKLQQLVNCLAILNNINKPINYNTFTNEEDKLQFIHRQAENVLLINKTIKKLKLELQDWICSDGPQ